MKKLNYIVTLAILLVCPLFPLACGHKNDTPEEQNADSKSDANKDQRKDDSTSDGKSDGHSDGQSDGTRDAVSDLDEWCDKSYKQHCVGNTVVWCGEEGQVISWGCQVNEGYSCQVLKGQNFADCVKSCNTLEDSSKKCDTSNKNQGYETLITAVCKETESGQKAVFNLVKENCSSCSDLSCHINSEDQGTDLGPEDTCTPLFKERCVEEQAYYCENNKVAALDCGARDKKCLIRAADTFAFCADEASAGCTEGEVTNYCQGNMTVASTCVMTTAGITYKQLSSYSCANGCNSQNGLCN